MSFNEEEYEVMDVLMVKSHVKKKSDVHFSRRRRIDLLLTYLFPLLFIRL